ncbi:MAG: DUF1992 domain-containing protein [Gammaproteobacteria bacterium]|nr:DUF1992 domain-containing protein [Gammaproteobacteria bacterium]
MDDASYPDAHAPLAASVCLSLVEHLAEQRIGEAMARGDFDQLPGAGKPLRLEDDGLVPEELRAAYRLLRNAGFLPPDVLVVREIREAEDLLRALDAPSERLHALQRLAVLRARLGERRSRALEALGYRDSLHRSLAK